MTSAVPRTLPARYRGGLGHPDRRTTIQEHRTMATQRYNGYANYETWAWALWIDNDEATQAYWLEQAQEALDDAKADYRLTRKETAAETLAEALADDAEQGFPLASGPYADLLNAAICEIDWNEIAEGLLADLEPSDADDEGDDA